MALIAHNSLSYYFYYYFYTQASLFLPFPAVVLLCKAEIHTQEKKVWYHVKIFINASCLAESESLNTFIFTASKNTFYELLLALKDSAGFKLELN